MQNNNQRLYEDMILIDDDGVGVCVNVCGVVCLLYIVCFLHLGVVCCVVM